MLLPTRVPGLAGVRRISNPLSAAQPCVLLDGGRVRCWRNSLEAPDDENSAVDVLSVVGQVCVRYVGDRTRCNAGDAGTVAFGIGAVAQFSGVGTSACALDRAGGVSCWGYPPRGVGFIAPRDLGVRCATSIASGAFHSCVSLTDGTVWCWGDNTYGQRGPGGDGQAPSRVPGIDRVVRVFRTASSSCAERDDGSLRRWGSGRINGHMEPAGRGVPFRVQW